ncbi:hypothetical protein AA309_20240 [Microvirga vignae]|uniref:Uncharacterized protein n=1 Tax=Microvirga vignae TaxID=1225564 RepID=A0A0H1R9A6_9HYPH|nr:hypothetical protein [Microvirga vignae]KLK91426.1 hypothetical protein AA309_20240 [Microvirga vignae]
MANETVLSLSGMGVAPYSARGLTQTLTPIGQATSVRRTINGGLVDLSLAAFRKYRSTISGGDQRAPSVDGVWPGQIVTVDCISELAYPVGGTPQRTVVAGSSHEDGGFVYYRPRLQMMVVGFTATQDEWGATVKWQLELEEV